MRFWRWWTRRPKAQPSWDLAQAAREAAAFLAGRGVQYVLVGTAGLAMRGFAVENVPDLDFLVSAPVPGRPCSYREESRYGSSDREFRGFKTQFIYVTEDHVRRKYFHPERGEAIDGVLVAALDDIIGLKRWRNREKDREFLRGWDAVMNRQLPEAM